MSMQTLSHDNPATDIQGQIHAGFDIRSTKWRIMHCPVCDQLWENVVRPRGTENGPNPTRTSSKMSGCASYCYHDISGQVASKGKRGSQDRQKSLAILYTRTRRFLSLPRIPIIGTVLPSRHTRSWFWTGISSSQLGMVDEGPIMLTLFVVERCIVSDLNIVLEICVTKKHLATLRRW